MELFRQISDSLTKVFGKVPPGKRLALMGMMVFVVAATIGLLYWAFRPHYKVLFSELSLKDSGDIVQELQDKNIPYRFEQDGTRILVPASDLYDTRLMLAGQELPGEQGVGWELFDQTNLGVTDFVQKLNYRRGLEGELARTILQLDPVEAVRVHLVMPEESLFRENQRETMASVTLRMNGRRKLSREQVEGVTYLVSSAVEGLSPENVTVVDSRGLILSERTEANPVIRLSASQLEIQRQVESNLVGKGQNLLDKRFGPDRSAIQVTVELDFQQRELTRELYDADNPSTRSEEITVNTSTGSDTSSSRNEATVTNYELNLTREHLVNPIGQVRRMSVAVMVDGNYETVTDPQSGAPQREFNEIPADELAEVASMIRSALGFNPTRGDEITVISVPFQDVNLIGVEDVAIDRWDLALRYGQKIMTLLAIILMLLMVRNFVRRAQTVAGRVSGPPQLAAGLDRQLEELGPLPSFEDELSQEARSASMLKEQVSDFVDEKPDTAAKLLKSWLVE